MLTSTLIEQLIDELVKKKALRKSYAEELRFSATIRDILESGAVDYKAFAETVAEITGIPYLENPIPRKIEKSIFDDEEQKLPLSMEQIFSLKAVPIEGGYGILYPLPQHEELAENLYIISYDKFLSTVKAYARRSPSEIEDYLSRNKILEAVLLMLVQASVEDASDIHILASSDVVRFRIGGTLFTFCSLQGKANEVARVFFSLSGKVPQNPHAQPNSIRLSGKDIVRNEEINKLETEVKELLPLINHIDFRIEIVPHPPSLLSTTARLLDRGKTFWKLDRLGLPSSTVDRLRRIVLRRGVLLVTGETGSGKTTTCYALLSEIDAVRHTLITIEDPIEFRNRFWKQLEYRKTEAIDLSFSRLLSSVLRQDPDVIFVGETRDAETAKLLFQASNTGHSVISTLHTNSAYDTIMRLRDLLASFSTEEEVKMKIVSFLKAVLSQRLLRRVCPYCSREEKIPHEIYSELERRTDGLLSKMGVTTHLVGRGCEKCRGTGYLGRVLVSEFVEITPEIAEKLLEGISKNRFESLMLEQGNETILINAVKKAAGLETNFFEIAEKL